MKPETVRRIREAPLGAVVPLSAQEMREVVELSAGIYRANLGNPLVFGRRVALRPHYCPNCGAPYEPHDPLCTYCRT